MQAHPSTSELARVLKSALAPSLLGLAVFSLVINLMYLVPPLYMLQVYDRVLTSASETTLILLTLIVAGLLASLGALDGVRSRMLVRISARIDLMLQGRLFESLFAQALRRPGQATTQGLQDLTQLRQVLTGQGLLVLLDLPWMPAYVALLFLFHSWFGWFAVASALLLSALAVANERLTGRGLAEANRAEIGASQRTVLALRNAEVVTAMGMLPGVLARWREEHLPALGGQVLVSDRAAALTVSSKVLRLLLQSLILGLGAYLTIEQEMTSGEMIAGTILLGRALAPIDQLTASWRGLMLGREAYRRLRELLANYPPPAEHMRLPAPTGRVVADRVVVVTDTGTPILKGISLSAEPGELLGVIGPSAAGKSTLARALLGLMPLYSGTVRLDGADIGQWNRADLGPYLGYLPQDIELFDGTVAENIARFGDVDPEAVVAAARRARVHELILGLPKGYDTPIGPAGVRLSPGQQQRIALARAIYGSPPFIVLDEPNSNLDDEGEQALVEALAELRAEGRAVLVITHRPLLLQRADRIAVLQQGQLLHVGTREQVLARFARPAGVAPLPRP
jgi:ATP-binding cassette subfamily C protein EexD